MSIKKAALLLLVVVAVLLGWWIGHSHKSSNTVNTNQVSAPANVGAKSLVSYTLPAGWSETVCPVSSIVYVVPSGTLAPNCNANPSSPMTISVDPQNTTDCKQLQNVKNVKKHICISLYIDGHKSLKASTQYSSSRTVSDYYINTGKGVVRTEYVYTSDNSNQEGFDQLATTVKVK